MLASTNYEVIDTTIKGIIPVLAQEANNNQTSGDWPQVQNNPQRTGYTPEILGTNFQVLWTHPFQPEKVFPQVQAIVYGGKVFVGTEMGNMYALDAQTGSQVWKYKVGAPIMNSVAAGDGKVFFGAMDGAVYALDAANGSLVWKSPLSWRHGFSTAPVLADNKLMMGGRNGIFYALNLGNGEIVWKYDVGAPILQTAAWNDGNVYFGAMDMHVYSLNSGDGRLVWHSEKVAGMAFKDYWPVIYNGSVYIRPMADEIWYGASYVGSPFVWFMGDTGLDWDWLMENGETIAQGGFSGLNWPKQVQDNFLSEITADPDIFPTNFYVFDEKTGQEMQKIPHWGIQTMNGATTPPCVDRDGLIIVPVYFVRSGWGRLSTVSNKIVDILYDHKDYYGNTMTRGGTPAGMGNPDESQNVTCSGNLVISVHTQESNAAYTGYFDLDSRNWTQLPPGHTNLQMSTNTQGGGGNPVSISKGILYHISWNELIARQAEN